MLIRPERIFLPKDFQVSYRKQQMVLSKNPAHLEPKPLKILIETWTKRQTNMSLKNGIKIKRKFIDWKITACNLKNSNLSLPDMLNFWLKAQISYRVPQIPCKLSYQAITIYDRAPKWKTLEARMENISNRLARKSLIANNLNKIFAPQTSRFLFCAHPIVGKSPTAKIKWS